MAKGPYRYKRAKNAPKLKRRRCLMCRETFIAEGPGNHVCGKCKQSKAWKSGNDYQTAGGPTEGV